MIDPIFKPKRIMHNPHTTGIKRILKIAVFIVRTIENMRNIAFPNLFFMEDLLSNTKMRGPEGPPHYSFPPI